MVKIEQGDSLTVLRTMPAESVHCCVTSPPYWGLRDYGVAGQYGLEAELEAYLARMVEVFQEVRRVLRKDGTAWVNMGDCYGTKGRWRKNLMGQPWRLALAMQDAGWYLRQDIVWHKPNCTPQSVRDRCTNAHEYLFLFSKTARYHYDAAAIKEPCVSGPSDIAKMLEKMDRIGGKNVVEDDRLLAASRHSNIGRKRSVGGTVLPDSYKGSLPGRKDGPGQSRRSALARLPILLRNKRSVWTIATAPYKGAHFATFPPKLIEPCILAGCPEGGVVLDPFGGSGTTGAVAEALGRNSILIELNPEYVKLAKIRTAQLGLLTRPAKCLDSGDEKCQ